MKRFVDRRWCVRFGVSQSSAIQTLRYDTQSSNFGKASPGPGSGDGEGTLEGDYLRSRVVGSLGRTHKFRITW